MDTAPEKKTIKNVVLEKILQGDVTAHSKTYFFLKNTLLVSAIIITSLFLFFVVSFIIFTLQESELWYLPMFGFRGVQVLLGNFPWVLTLIVLFFIGILEILVSRYGFAYRRPLLYSALAVIFIVISTSFLVRLTPLHDAIYSRIEKGGMPMARPLYDEYAKPKTKDFYPGTVIEITGSGFTIERPDKTLLQVNVTDRTKMAPGFRIYPGGRLLIIGKQKNNIVEAEAVENAPKEGRPE